MLGAKNPLNNPFLGDTRLHPITRGFRVIHIKRGALSTLQEHHTPNLSARWQTGNPRRCPWESG